MPESHWLERELTRQLCPVEAPEELWDRLERRPGRRHRPSLGWTVWPVAAAVALMVVGSTAWRLVRAHGPASLEALAAETLRDEPGRLDFLSSDPQAIRTWVKAKTDLAIDLPARNGAVRLLGARLIERDGAPVAAVAYRVGDARATLLVARAEPPATGTRTSRHRFTADTSWRMRGQVYSLACSAKQPRIACLLCHAEPPAAAN